MADRIVRCLNPMCKWREQDRPIPPPEQVGDGLFRADRIICECGSDVWKGTAAPTV